ncbi:MAG: DNA methyltransferase, partial [Synechococcales cyanobacterium RM1_1_8]|nr:DNA methyltransferase [Synechococcales cyanobacterium RM1_1_8]
AAWQQKVLEMAGDLDAIAGQSFPPSHCFQQDSRWVGKLLQPQSIDAVITSPPYPNEKDYTRTTRLESVLLGYLHSKADLRALKQGLMRSNSRNVYRLDQDDRLIQPGSSVDRLAQAIEQKRLDLGKTSGFERAYHRVTRLYFGGMQRHLQSLQPALRPGARLAYVVGDQASFLRVMIRTGELLAEIAEGIGYEVETIDLFRTRVSTATGDQLREEVVLLRWKG